MDMFSRISMFCKRGLPIKAGLGTLILKGLTVDERQISSAVSAVLRGKNFSRVEAADAEQCGYGDLR
jgi:hypothetical protein